MDSSDFLYQGYEKLDSNGRLGMIMPDVVLYQKDNAKLRIFLLNNSKINYVLNMGAVFENVTRPSAILLLEKNSSTKNKVKIADLSSITRPDKSSFLFSKKGYKEIIQNDIFKIPGAILITSDPASYSIWNKIKGLECTALSELVDEDGIQRGVSPDLKRAFIVEKSIVHKYKLEKDKIRPVLTGGRQVKRYYIDYPDLQLIYIRHSDDPKDFPNIYYFISQFKEEITCKEVKEKKHPFYALHRPREERIFLKEQKILGVITEDEIKVSLDSSKIFATDGLYLFSMRKNYSANYLISILNSKLFIYIYRLISLEKGRVLAQVKPSILNELPIRKVNNSNSEEKTIHDNLVALVDVICDLNKIIQIAKGAEKDQIQRQIESTDKEIDQLVYKLYGLTKDEIKIVEGETK